MPAAIAIGVGVAVGSTLAGKAIHDAVKNAKALDDAVSDAQANKMPQMQDAFDECIRTGSAEACGKAQACQQDYFKQNVNRGINSGAGLSNVPSGGMPQKVGKSVYDLRK